MNTNDVLLMLYRKIMSADEFFISRTLIKMNGDLKFKYMLIIIIYRWRQHRSVFSIQFDILNKFDWASSLMNYILFNDRTYFRKKKLFFFLLQLMSICFKLVFQHNENIDKLLDTMSFHFGLCLQFFFYI